MILALAIDTALMVSINLALNKNNNLIDPEHLPLLTPEEIADRSLGSKLTMVTEQAQILVTWLVKTCLLIMYNRLTSVLPSVSHIIIADGVNRFGSIQRLCIKIVAAYVALGFVVMEVSLPGPLSSPLRQKKIDAFKAPRAFSPATLETEINLTDRIDIILRRMVPSFQPVLGSSSQ